MKREDVIQALEEAAARNSSLASEYDRSEQSVRLARNNSTAAMYSERAHAARRQVGLGLAAINHLNGVSPE